MGEEGGATDGEEGDSEVVGLVLVGGDLFRRGVLNGT